MFFVIQREILKIMKIGKYMFNKSALEKQLQKCIYQVVFMIWKYGLIFPPIEITLPYLKYRGKEDILRKHWEIVITYVCCLGE